MDIKKIVSEFLRFIQRFGLMRGVYLFLRIKLISQNNIKLPGIPHPFSLRKGTSDFDTFYQAIIHNQYKFNYGIKPEVIIDGGANIGLVSIVFKEMFPDAKIIAVEPDKENFEQLKKNVAPYKDIHTIQAGLWFEKSFLKISDKYKAGKWGMVTEKVKEESSDTIKAITIKQIMDDFSLGKIDILKLDIETSERELFSTGYEDWLPKTKVLIVELHDFMSKGTSKPFFKAINATFENYSFFQLGENTIIINEDRIAEKWQSIPGKVF
ncbi:MAG TPA: FkbM family methyltransferase [Ginsengibacter sp.]